MTAINVIIDNGVAHIVTDGGVFFGKRLAGIRTKVLPVPHLGIAVAVRGKMNLAHALTYRVSSYASVAALEASLARDMRRAYGWRARLCPWLWNFDIVIAGSDGRDAFAFLVSSAAHPGYRRFENIDIDFLYATPQPKAGLLEGIAERWRSDIAGLTTNFDSAALKILEDQRGTGIVAGFAQVTSIYGQRILTRILKKWPDQLEGLRK